MTKDYEIKSPDAFDVIEEVIKTKDGNHDVRHSTQQAGIWFRLSALTQTFVGFACLPNVIHNRFRDGRIKRNNN